MWYHYISILVYVLVGSLFFFLMQGITFIERERRDQFAFCITASTGDITLHTQGNGLGATFFFLILYFCDSSKWKQMLLVVPDRQTIME